MKNLLKNTVFFNRVGTGLKPGAHHYRAYVGPPADYDLVAAMVFNLLTCLGLRQHHRVLDVGCGSLRIGRLLIPYLNTGNYIGVEPNQWLVQNGIQYEVGEDMIRLKKPTFSYHSSLNDFKKNLKVDFAVAQSIFSHCSKALINEWLDQISDHLKDDGVLFATFLVGTEDFEGDGWVYPDCVKYIPGTIEKMASEQGLSFEIIDWKHPRQTWAMFSKPGFDKSLIVDGNIAWNHVVEKFTQK
jgi:cyclopropane fatty-acyl-phospholipid synthase-like methyltransferase